MPQKNRRVVVLDIVEDIETLTILFRRCDAEVQMSEIAALCDKIKRLLA